MVMLVLMIFFRCCIIAVQVIIMSNIYNDIKLMEINSKLVKNIKTLYPHRDCVLVRADHRHVH